ncbi:MAG: VCBS repeat-containing protein [Acidobacteria bacterium]|nr:VCBS repeat-containing protein [Acidobacteriota bacterium]
MDKRTSILAGLVACGAAFAVFAAAGASQSVDLQRLRNRGQATYEEQRYADAVAAFTEILLDAAATPQDRLNLAVAQYRNGDEEASLRTLADAGDLLDDHPGAPYLRGLITRRTGALGDARPALERARDLDSTDPAIRYNLGAVYAQLGLQDEALAEFEVVTAMGFDVALQHYVSALYQHFQILLRRGQRQEAEPEIALYREANQRLSQAARSPAALEQSRSTFIVVPDLSLQPADPDSAQGLRFSSLGAPIDLPAGGSVAVADLNRDGRPDWLTTGPTGQVWLSTGSGHAWREFSTPAGLAGLGDFDRDGWPDLYVGDVAGDRLFRNVLGDGRDDAVVFEPVEAEGLPSTAAASGVLWLDYDHDGDLDVLITHAGGSLRLLRNLGGGAFDDTTSVAGLDDARAGQGALWADFDHDYDVDLFLWGENGTELYSNQRGGRFMEIGSAVGAGVVVATSAAVAEDFDNDGRIDLLLATADGLVALRNMSGGTFQPVDLGALAGLRADALDAADFNNDSYLDLVLTTAGPTRFFVNAGGFAFVPFDPLPSSGAVLFDGAPTRFLAASDIDGNGGVDIMVEQAGQLFSFVQPEPAGNWLAVNVVGIKNNLNGIGANIEVKVDGSYQLRPLRSTPLHFGIGSAEGAEILRITWPNGIVQNLFDVAADQLVTTTELERLEGSCPFLYTWDGRGFHFVNEVLGASPLGMLLAEGLYHVPDPQPDEYVFVPGEQLRAVDGSYQIRLTEELRETTYLDAVRILAIDHPESLEVLPDEAFGGRARPGLRLYAHEQLLPVRATDQAGVDWTNGLAAIDGTWARPFEPAAYDGLATAHSVTLELPEIPGDGPVHLYLTGWVYWSMGSVNLAIDQDPRTEFTPVSLEVPDGQGGWRTAIEDIGLPVAKNSTLIVDVTSVLNRADARVRIGTTMRLYWDAMAYGVGGEFAGGLVPSGDWQLEHGVPRVGVLELRPADARPSAAASAGGVDGSAAPSAVQAAVPLRVHVLAPSAAELRPRGFSAVSRTADGYETFDYQTLVPSAPWEQHPGFYTAFGDVNELLDAADDRYVVLATGDEVAISFEASLPPLPEGWRRDFLVYLHGWLKDTDLNTAYGDRVGPLPFHGMSGYPYPAGESYPDDAEHQRFLERYLTRPARPINPPLIDGQRRD